MALPDEPGPRHREVAGRFGHLVAGVGDWDAPTPVPQWVARDVVTHLTTWLPGLLSSTAGIELPATGTDPVQAWSQRSVDVQGLLDDPHRAGRVLAGEHVAGMRLEQVIDRFYTADVFLHTWDLARATGQDEQLDPAMCEQMLRGMQEMEELLRSSGQYGPAVPVPPDAPVQDRLVGFIGRDPEWRPARTR